MAPRPQRSPMSEEEVEQLEGRLRRIFIASFCLSLLLLMLLVFLLQHWAGLPGAFRKLYMAILMWSFVVTAYCFYSQVCVSDKMKEVLRHKTFIDEVTGVFNYRYLDLRLAEEAERTRRHGGFTALLYLDLDGFKQVNDRFGHQVGNTVLEELGTQIAQSMRSCDVFGRIGGDEFLAVLPQTDRREGYVLAERIRQEVGDYSLDVGEGQKIDFLTASIGIAAFPVNGETMDNVITAADNAVYSAKQQGGDRVAMADEFVSADVLGEDIMHSVRGEEEEAEPS